MAESKKHDEVILMTSALARLFRASLSKGREMIPIATEVEHITNYLKIQQMRYQDKIRFTLDMDRELYPYLTLKPQPLVENAIYHGIKNKEGPGTITITGRLQDDRIRFQVMDDGIGMDRSKVETLLISTGSQHSRNSVGIANVHQRIQLYFGAEYGLSYTSVPGAGTIVTVLIPAVHPDEWRSMKGRCHEVVHETAICFTALIPVFILGYAVYQWSKDDPVPRRLSSALKHWTKMNFGGC